MALESSISMQVAFKNVEDAAYAVYTFTDHNGKKQSVTVDVADFIDGYGVELSAIVMADARQMVTCTVYNESDEVLASVTDSVESYVARSADDALFEGIMKFADSAYNFFH